MPRMATGPAPMETDGRVPRGVLTMGLRERLQSVTRFFENAATKGRRLRQEDERDEIHAPASGEPAGQRTERQRGEGTAEDGDGEGGGRQRSRDR